MWIELVGVDDMKDDEIILRLTRELCDLKAKLGVIRQYNDNIYKKIKQVHIDLDDILLNSINIANELDKGVDYD